MSKKDQTGWYDLFSRGARDWLRHNEKVRETVTRHLPDLVSGADVLSTGGNRVVRVPVKFLEHYRFRLRDTDSGAGVGQGQANAGDLLHPGDSTTSGKGKGGGGNNEGGLEFVLEFKVDDIVDWMWEELDLPNLQPKAAKDMDESTYVRSGWDKHGARARLDRRRTMKESIKRRVVQNGQGIPFSNEDLRFRQLVKKPQPTTRAAVIFVLDVSASMTEQDRRLAKTFFFWALQGIRRQYNKIEVAFVAHTVEAWEFSEEEFFQASGHGGTVASTGFQKALEITKERYSPEQYNLYMFYASDGENFPEDRRPAESGLAALAQITNYLGYVEVSRGTTSATDSETTQMFTRAAERDLPVGQFVITSEEEVWDAIQKFFRQQAEQADE